MHEQMHYIQTHGLYIIDVFANSVTRAFDMYYRGYIGTLGWLETKMPVWFIHVSYLILIFVALMDGNKVIKIKLFHRLIFLAIVIIISCLIILSQHLVWDCVGSDAVANLQGRYFIPVFPFLFMMLYSRRFNVSKFIVALVIVYSFFSLSLTVNTIYKRYYVASAIR
jgi:uncharacterized membrane protein